MELTVYWTQFAEEKLDDIYHYYSFRAGITVAEDLVNGIIDKSLELNNHPERYPLEELLADRIQGFRYMVYNHYKILYWVDHKKRRVLIAHVFDTRQNPTELKRIP